MVVAKNIKWDFKSKCFHKFEENPTVRVREREKSSDRKKNIVYNADVVR